MGPGGQPGTNTWGRDGGAYLINGSQQGCVHSSGTHYSNSYKSDASCQWGCAHPLGRSVYCEQ